MKDEHTYGEKKTRKVVQRSFIKGHSFRNSTLLHSFVIFPVSETIFGMSGCFPVSQGQEMFIFSPSEAEKQPGVQKIVFVTGKMTNVMELSLIHI